MSTIVTSFFSRLSPIATLHLIRYRRPFIVLLEMGLVALANYLVSLK